MTAEEKDRFVKTWRQPVWEAVLRRIAGRGSMTANEIIDDLNAPAEVRPELRRFVVALLFLLLNKGYVTDSAPRCTNR